MQKFVTSMLTAAILIMPVFAFADIATGQLIEQLRTQIAELQTQVNALLRQQTFAGTVIKNNIGFGLWGADVVTLQNALKDRGLYSGPVTGYFGALTREAVKKFQTLYGIPNTGFVGPLTRNFLRTTSFTVTNGSHTLTVTARDAAGNQTTSAKIVVSDTTPPSVPAGFTASAVSSSQINLSWSASGDNVGVTGYRVERCQGSSCAAFIQIVTLTGTNYSDTGLSPSTAYTYRVYAYDAAGNVSEYSTLFSTTTDGLPDITPPSVSITAPANGTTVSDTVTVSAFVFDNIDVVGVQFKLDGANLGLEDVVAPYSVSWNTAAIPNGSHTLTATVRDTAGNQTTAIGVTITVSNIFSCIPEAAFSLYVSPGGNDQAAGTLDAPLQTLKTAIARIQKDYFNCNVSVLMREGTYYMDSKVVITGQTGSISIKPYNNEVVRISGAVPVVLKPTGTQNGFRLFTGFLPIKYFSLLPKLMRQSIIRIGDGTAYKARFPNRDYNVFGYLGAKIGKTDIPGILELRCGGSIRGVASMAGSIALPETLPSDYDLSNAFLNIFIHDSWGNAYAPVRRDGSFLVATGSDVFMTGCVTPEPGSRYFIENIPQALDDANEFYIDSTSGEIRWLAPAIYAQTEAIAYVPVTRTLVSVNNRANLLIENIQFFDGLADFGLIGAEPRVLLFNAYPAIEIVNSFNVAIRKSFFRYFGTAVGGETTKQLEIFRNDIGGMYSHGIRFFGGSTSPVKIIKNSVVGIGKIDKDARGMQLGVSNSIITGNYLDFLPRAGITCVDCSNTEISYNTVRNAGNATSDLGALHTGGNFLNNSINWFRNYVFTVFGVGSIADGSIHYGFSGHGFYADTFANNQTVSENIFSGPLQKDIIAGAFNNVVSKNFLLGYPAYSLTGYKILTNVSAGTYGTLTASDNFGYVDAKYASLYKPNVGELVTTFSPEDDASRVVLTGENLFVRTRAIAPNECEAIQNRINTMAPQMHEAFCKNVINDLAYLACPLTISFNACDR